MQECFLLGCVVHVLSLAKIIDAALDNPLFQLLAYGLGPFLDKCFIVVAVNGGAILGHGSGSVVLSRAA